MTPASAGGVIDAPRHDGDWEQFTSIEGQAFGTSREKTERYIAPVRDHVIARFAFDGDRVVAGALALRCAQIAGARPVAAGGVASVCVLPEARGRGPGRWVMSSLVTVIDPARALQQSGWPADVEHRLDFAVGEPGTPPHHFTLEVAGGSAHVTPGGAGRVRIGVGAFSSWFVGGMRAETAARLGFADGEPHDLAIMDMLTADRRPWLPDTF